MITGTIRAPVPVDPDNPMADKTSAIDAFEAPISFRIAGSAKSVLGSTEDPRVAWESLEKCCGAKQQGLQSVLMTDR